MAENLVLMHYLSSFQGSLNPSLTPLPFDSSARSLSSPYGSGSIDPPGTPSVLSTVAICWLYHYFAVTLLSLLGDCLFVLIYPEHREVDLQVLTERNVWHEVSKKVIYSTVSPQILLSLCLKHIHFYANSSGIIVDEGEERV